MVMFKKLTYWGIAAALCFALIGMPCFAQGVSGSSGQLPLPLPSQKPGETNQVAPSQPTRQGLSDPQELEAFLKKFLPEEMQTTTLLEFTGNSVLTSSTSLLQFRSNNHASHIRTTFTRC
jgi:hypothetical protein